MDDGEIVILRGERVDMSGRNKGWMVKYWILGGEGTERERGELEVGCGKR